ncbi:uncharacterized protein LOC122258219 [Penaeus japonicus]|uniref:uncharacterized protein LOC122258219 n=1 Tax=Penaeus japonicus TaxID=27405 RepID=UPI001C70F3A8|nr:uncharacterized protein LOC122258219 [Penaeus japonicus]
MLVRETVEVRVIGKYGYGARNDEDQTIVNFAHRTDMAVINTFYSKRESHNVTYTNGGRHTQIDYILCRRVHLKEGRDCKVIPGESVAKQHHVVIGKMRLMSRRRREDMKNKAKVAVTKAKKEASEEIYEKLDKKEEENMVYGVAKQRDRAAKDVQQIRLIKDTVDRVLPPRRRCCRDGKTNLKG